MTPTVSVVLTINNRPKEVIQQVSDSLELNGNEYDELIVVLDRPLNETEHWAKHYFSKMTVPARFVEILGSINRDKPTGIGSEIDRSWKGPARAWNAGFKFVTCDLTYCISSETVQQAGNIDKARAVCTDLDRVVFGACWNSQPTQLVTGAEPGLLVDSTMARPLGFIAAIPTAKIKAIKGFDEEFMKGYWYDDDDFFYRLWKTGLDFEFNDKIAGTHLHHERPDLETPEGQNKINTNRKYFLEKHGILSVWSLLPKIETKKPGKTIWEHP